jgi:hypothetical protein
LRLLPSDVLARVELVAHAAAQLEVDLATRLAGTDSPVAALDPRVPRRVYERDGFAITLWTHYPTQPSRDLSPPDYADALSRLHVGLLRVDLATPTSRIVSRTLSGWSGAASGLRSAATRTGAAAGVDVRLADPRAQTLEADAQVAGGAGQGVARGGRRADRFSAELGRIRRAWVRHQ